MRYRFERISFLAPNVVLDLNRIEIVISRPFLCLQNILRDQNILWVSKFLHSMPRMLLSPYVLGVPNFIGMSAKMGIFALGAKYKHYEKTKPIITKRMVNYWRIRYVKESAPIR